MGLSERPVGHIIGELDKSSACREFRHTAKDGKGYNTTFYNLDAVISVGYRVNSARTTQFRQWATGVPNNPAGTTVWSNYGSESYVADLRPYQAASCDLLHILNNSPQTRPLGNHPRKRGCGSQYGQGTSDRD